MVSLKVGMLLFPNSHLLDLSGPAQALDSINLYRPGAIELHFIAPTPEVDTHQGPRLAALSPLPQDDTVYDLLIVSGCKFHPAMLDQADCQTGLRWLQNYAQRAPHAQIASVCTGAFFLARAGLLNERSCTTHHAYVKHLQEEAPTASIRDHLLFVRDGNIRTSAGVTAGTDMILDWIASVFDDDLAELVARELVIYTRPCGDLSEISERRRYRNHLDRKVHALQDEIAAAPQLPWTPEQLEEKANLGYRQLTRRFRHAAGISIKQYQLTLQLDMAYRLLQEKYYTIEQLSNAVGFQSPHAFRRTWKIRYGRSPSAFRRPPDELD